MLLFLFKIEPLKLAVRVIKAYAELNKRNFDDAGKNQVKSRGREMSVARTSFSDRQKSRVKSYLTFDF
jgi:hypothetical protein